MHRFGCVPCLLLIVFLGCTTPQNAPSPPTAQVKGKVKLDGKDMAEGTINFAIVGFPPKEIPIKDGAFSGEAHVGKNQVSIVLLKDGPPAMPDSKEPTKINSVTHKELSAEVKEGGGNDFSFEATTK